MIIPVVIEFHRTQLQWISVVSHLMDFLSTIEVCIQIDRNERFERKSLSVNSKLRNFSLSQRFKEQNNIGEFSTKVQKQEKWFTTKMNHFDCKKRISGSFFWKQDHSLNFEVKLQLHTSTSNFSLKLHLQTSSSNINFKIQFQYSDFNFKLQMSTWT